MGAAENVSKLEQNLEKFSETGVDLNIGLKENQKNIAPRRFKGKDLEDVLGVKAPTITTAETAGRISFDRDEQKRRLGATHEQMMAMQEVFGTSPRCRDDERGVILSITSLKGGSWKSSNCQFMGTYYASLGLRVCLVDLDPQASLTLNVGKLPDIEVNLEDTMLNYICDMAGYPHSMIGSVVQDTHIPNMKIIPSCLAMAHCEVELSAEMAMAQSQGDEDEKKAIMTRVKKSLDVLRDDFDVIIIDGTPSINMLAMNIMLACDACIIPCATEPTDFAATISFCSMLKTQLESIRNGLGEGMTDFFPEIKVLPTRFSTGNASSGSKSMLETMRSTFGESCLDNYIKKHDAVVSNLSLIRRTVFDTNGGTIKSGIGDIKIASKARKSAIENFSASYDEILEKLVLPLWPNRKNDTLTLLRGSK